MKNLALLSFSLFIIILGRKFFINKAQTPEKFVQKEAVNKSPEIVTSKKNPPKRVLIKNNEDLKKALDQRNKKIQATPDRKDDIKPVKKTYPYQEGFVRIREDGAMIISSIAIDGELAVTHGDILIGSKDEVMELNRVGKAIVIPKPQLWPNKTIHYEIDSNLSNYQEVKKSIDYFNSLGIVQFVEGYSDNYLYFRYGNNNCYSYIGMKGGEQDISLSPNCKFRQINHEILHALGLHHEQSREDRDDFIKINWENIQEEYHPQFHKLPNDYIGVEDTKFDFQSIMLYPPNAFSKDPESPSMTTLKGEHYQINQTGELSKVDKERLKNLYK